MNLEPRATLPTQASAMPQNGTYNPLATLAEASNEPQAFRQTLQEQMQSAGTLPPGAAPVPVQASLDSILHLSTGEHGDPARTASVPPTSAGNFLPPGRASGENDAPDTAVMAWLAQLLTPPGQTLAKGDSAPLDESASSQPSSDPTIAFMSSASPMPALSTMTGTPTQREPIAPPIFPRENDPLPATTAPMVTQATFVAVKSARPDATVVFEDVKAPSAPTSTVGPLPLPSESAVLQGIHNAWIETSQPNRPGTPHPFLVNPALPHFASEPVASLNLVDLQLSNDRESISAQTPSIETSAAAMPAIPRVGEDTSPNLEHSAVAAPFLSANVLTVPNARTETLPVSAHPIDHPEWQQDLGDRVLWMTNHGKQVAELTLHPAELGPLEVRIQFNQEQASIQFLSSHAAVREAVESALPKLREMFGTQHIELHDVTVAQPSFSDPRGSAFATDHQHPGSGGEQRHGGSSAVEPTRHSEPDTASVTSLPNKGLLNLYA